MTRKHDRSAAIKLGTVDGARARGAIIAAGWSIDDTAAVAFATTFYQQMLAGTGLGDAVKNARHNAYNERRTSMTWAAYQCYGDPEFRLRTTL